MNKRKEANQTNKKKNQLTLGGLDLEDSDALSLDFEEEFVQSVILHDN